MCYSEGQGCHPEGPKQTRRKDQQEPQETQKGKLPSASFEQANTLQWYGLGTSWLDSNSDDKDLTVLVDSRLQISHQSPSFAVVKANSILGYMKRSAPSRLRAVIIPRYLVFPVSGILCPVWGPPGVMLMSLSEFNGDEPLTKMVRNWSTYSVRRG